ncbi:DUF1702 family protein [Neorhizobium sp. T25_13]|uniref:DUF1702 family protein n=1 Tax=Neorhizobium sp. T25_13 TaxID=2093830 RepID=UPI002110D098|nr:DUF1702 family protein [Neorhizobium sp. T25_13]
MNKPDDDVGAAPPSGLTFSAARFTRRFAGLGLHEAHLSVRGFEAVTSQARSALEEAGMAFVQGYNYTLGTSETAAIGQSSRICTPRLRGFFMEGAAMGVGVRDAMPWHMLSKAKLPIFLTSAAVEHPYLTTVGAGWAMARLPWRRSRIFQSLDGLLAPLAFDGWGFHDCYFRRADVLMGPARAVSQMAGPLGVRAWDQGAGRALWFVCGGSIDKAAGLIATTLAERRSDLFAGLGLAVTYAGGIEPSDAEALLSAAGPFRWHVAQGAAFALEAHIRARTETPDSLLRGAILTGVDACSAVEIVRAAMPARTGNFGGVTAQSWTLYERWRTCVSHQLEKAAGETR